MAVAVVVSSWPCSRRSTDQAAVEKGSTAEVVAERAP